MICFFLLQNVNKDIGKEDIYIAQNNNWIYKVIVVEKENHSYELKHTCEYIGDKKYEDVKIKFKIEYNHSANFSERTYTWNSERTSLPNLSIGYPNNTSESFVTPRKCTIIINEDMEETLFVKMKK